LPYCREALAPRLQTGRRPIIAAHGNTLRALVKYLEGISDAEIVGLEIPTGIPLVYELDNRLEPSARYYLGSTSAAPHAQEALDHLVRTRPCGIGTARCPIGMRQAQFEKRLGQYSRSDVGVLVYD
jgi:broad specificity phosphatase PhoE